MIPYLHHSGGVVCEPVDLPANKRHLDMLYTHIRTSDRPFMGAFIGAERARDAVEMAKILFGADFVAENCCLYNVANTNAPLVLDANMSGSLKVYARAGQPVACTPWTLAGAMSPCTVAGTLTQVLAEALACLALVQLINPGAPALMGSFASTMSMQSGAPTFGTPEAAKMVLASGQLARRLGVPLHTVGSPSRPPSCPTARPSRRRPGGSSWPSSPAPTSSTTPPAGSRAASSPASRRRSSTPTSAARWRASSKASTSPPTP